MQMVQGQDWNRLPGGNVINTTEWLGADFGSTIPLSIETRADQPIDFSTSNQFRARINEKISYASLNSFQNIDASGFMLVTPDDGFLGQVPKGPFSRLHLAEGGPTGNAQQWGYIDHTPPVNHNMGKLSFISEDRAMRFITTYLLFLEARVLTQLIGRNR
ncbi:MAG: hypothetical protein J5I62_10990 [Flavobacteriales bacterium]|nr:hypothetical protein [Flavobacteriales bacterium]